MYFPILRGKQFDLIAIRELIEKNLIGNKIIPVVEPVSPSSTLYSLLDLCSINKKEIIFITNPQISDFQDKFMSMEASVLKEKLTGQLEEYKVTKINGHILTDIELTSLSQKETLNNIAILHDNVDFLDEYENNISVKNPKYNFIPDEGPFRRKVKQNRVLLSDSFNKQVRNSDYGEDEAFSEDHLYFSEDNYIGFSDYSIVGKDYSESGFAPYAVAIHIVYFTDEKKLRIKHFVSNSNTSTNNPAGKFGEALAKLIEWKKDTKIDTYALRQFEQFNKDKKYPGLGVVKKLSIMHHLELMNQYIEKVDAT